MTIVRDGWRLEDGYCGQRIVASVTEDGCIGGILQKKNDSRMAYAR